jgi:broad specificity phosphatase PhoE
MPLLGLIRHAPTEWNREGRVQGRADTPLSDEGRAMLAGWIPPAQLLAADWVSSPLQRCRETARHLAGYPVPTDPILQEMDWGEWQGHTLEELRRSSPDEMHRREAMGWDFAPPNGESPRDVSVRFKSFLERIARQDRPTVAVTHRGVIRVAYALATGWDFLGKPPFTLEREAAQLFWLDASGLLEIRAANVPLTGGNA